MYTSISQRRIDCIGDGENVGTAVKLFTRDRLNNAGPSRQLSLLATTISLIFRVVLFNKLILLIKQLHIAYFDKANDYLVLTCNYLISERMLRMTEDLNEWLIGVFYLEAS